MRLVTLITILCESDGYQYANTTSYPFSRDYPHDKDGKNKNSVGLYQQRPQWWYVRSTDSVEKKVADLMNDVTSTNLFLDALENIKDWRKMEPWEAAQAVQRSPFLDGSNYRDRLETATKILASGPMFFTNGAR